MKKGNLLKILIAIGFVFQFSCQTQPPASLSYYQHSPCLVERVKDQESLSSTSFDGDAYQNLQENFSKRSLELAAIIGIENELKKLVEGNLGPLPHLQNRQKINESLEVFHLQVSALSAAFDCEEERTEQVADFLVKKEQRNQSYITAGAISVGAVGAIVIGVLIINNSSSRAIDITGIGIGVLEASLATASLLGKKSIYFQHEQNLLVELWKGREAVTRSERIIPKNIWDYLSLEDPSHPSQMTYREQLIDRWESFGEIDIEDPEEQALFWGKGGKYNSSQLMTRSDMHDQAESTINLIKQDLLQFRRELMALP